jgi:outer membrane protein
MLCRYFIFLVLSITSTSISGQEKWSLSKCVDYGLANSYTIRQHIFQTQVAETAYKQSKNAFLPTASISLSPGISFGRSPVQNAFEYTNQSIFNSGISSGTSLTLLDGKSTRRTIEKNKLNWKNILAQSEQLKDDIILSITGLYLQALLSKELIRISELQFRQSEAQYDNTLKQVKAGVLPELNAAELEAQLAKDSLNIILANESFEQNLLSLKSYMSFDPATPFDIETPAADKIPVASFATLEPAVVYGLALANQPQLQVDSLQLRMIETDLFIAKAGLKPRLSLDLGLSSGFSRVMSKTSYSQTSFFKQVQNNFRQYAGLSFSIPLFDAFATKSKIARNKIDIESQQMTIDQDKLSLKQAIYKAHLDAVTAFQKLNASAISIKTAERSFSFAEKRYSVGLLSTLDLLTNQNSLFKVKQEYVLNQYEYIFKMKVLEFYKRIGLYSR